MLRPTLLLLSAAAIAAACGGATATDLFGPPEQSELPGEPSELEGHDNGGPASVAYGRMDASGGDSDGSIPDGSIPNDVSSPPPATIFCGSEPDDERCVAGSEVCCVGGNTKPDYRCRSSNAFAPCSGGIPIRCDDRSDCPNGEVCCASLPNRRGPAVRCEQTCESEPGIRRQRMCDPNAAIDECAEIGKQCKKSRALPGYYVCSD